MRAWLASLILIAAAATAPAQARADARGEARALYERGQALYDDAEYHRAAGYFLRAYQRSDEPGLLFNAAQAYRLAGACDLSAALYRDYLRAAPRSPHRALVETHIAEMEACELNRPARSPAAGTDRPPQRSARSVAGWTSMGTGALLLGSSALLAVKADRASDALGDDGRRSKKGDDDDAGGGDYQRWSWITAGLGATAVVTGAVLLLTGDDDERQPISTPRVATVRGGAVVGWSWGF